MPSPGDRIGKYVVRKKIAEGGMAEIFLCASAGPEGFEKEVVIKRIRSFLAGDPEFIQMFIEEAKLASRLNHPNVVQIFDFAKHEDSYYLAMEYIRGPSLWDVRKRSKELFEPMLPAMVAHVASEIARGLHHAHSLKDKGTPIGLVHRDVTPHNILVSWEGAVKLTDFGIAKAGTRATAPGVLKGKLAYMAPEQARGERVDARTDVFALGITLWEFLTGGRLFEADSDVGVIRAVQEMAIPPPARINPEVPAELNDIVVKALQRDASARFQSASDIERALKRFVLGSTRSLDDVDVAAYLRKLFGDRHIHSVAGFEVEALADTSPQRGREVSQDEDAHADTYRLPNRVADGKVEPAESGFPSSHRTRLFPRAMAVVLVLVVGGAGLWWQGRANDAALPTNANAQPPPPSTAPLPPVPQPAVAPPSVAPPSVVRSSEPSAAKTPRLGKGTLRVRATPWAYVFVDERLLGEVSPEGLFSLSEGKHRLRMENRENGWQEQRTITIRAGREVSVDVRIPIRALP